MSEPTFLTYNRCLSNMLLEGDLASVARDCQVLLDEMWSEYIKKDKTGKILDLSLMEKFKAGEYKGIGPVDTEGVAYLVEIADDKSKVFKYKKVMMPKVSFDTDTLEEAAQVKINDTVVVVSDLRWVFLKNLGANLASFFEKCAYPTYVFTTPKVFIQTQAFFVEIGIYLTLAEESRIELFHQYITEQKAQQINEAIQESLQDLPPYDFTQVIKDCFPKFSTNFTKKIEEPIH